MAVKELFTRIALKYDTYANWMDENKGGKLILLKGEIGLCEVPTTATGDDKATNAPAVLFKVGDGTKTFSELQWASAKAADVYSWAKASDVVYDSTAKTITFVKGNEDGTDKVFTFNYVTAAEVDAQIKAITNDVESLIDKELEKFSGTIEITPGDPEKENTVLIIDPNSNSVTLYTAEEIDEIKENLQIQFNNLIENGYVIKTCNINEAGELVITYSDESNINLGKVVGSDGKQGPKGEIGPQGIQGPKGDMGPSGVYVGSGEIPEGCNVQIDPEGEVDEFVTKEELQQLSETVINNNNISTKHFNNTDIHVTDEEKVLWNNKCGEVVTGKILTDSSGNEYTGGINAERFNGDINVAKGKFSHAEGYITIASGDYSHSEGHNTLASGARSHAEGNLTKSTAAASHAEGNSTTASGKFSHAEGDNTTASGISSHAEGDHTNAVGLAAHAEGTQTSASGIASHSEGKGTIASADYTHAQGHSTVATGWASHAEGRGTKAISNSQHVQGRWNTPVNHIHVVGCGTGEDGQVDDKGDPTYRANIHHLTTEGEGWFAKGTTTTNADYAEYYEWLDGNLNNEDRIGLMVTLDGEKIKLANSGDEILGIISGTAAVIGDDPASSWKHKYLTDDFGRVIYEDREDFEEIIVEKINEETGETYEETEMVSLGFSKYPVLNPEYDPTQEYIPRSERPEWDIVGLLGKLYVRDDGTATVNGYVTVGENGFATTSLNKTNMRVLSRVKDNIIKVQKQ